MFGRLGTKLRDEAVLSKLLDCCEMYLPRFIKLLKDKDEGIAEKAFIGAHNFSTEKHGRAVLLRAFLTTEASVCSDEDLYNYYIFRGC